MILKVLLPVQIFIICRVETQPFFMNTRRQVTLGRNLQACRQMLIMAQAWRILVREIIFMPPVEDILPVFCAIALAVIPGMTPALLICHR